MRIGSCTDCKRGYQKITEISGLCEQCFRKRNNREKLGFIPKKKCICSPDCKIMIPDYGDNKFAYGHSQKGEFNSRYKGGRYIDGYGYILIKSPNHPNKDSKGYVKEHRLVMEQHLGRYLRRDELVHHDNENKQDNRIENLQLITRSLHQNHHNPRKGYKIDTSDRLCLLCNTDNPGKNSTNGNPHWLTYKDGFICRNCYYKQQRRNKK